MFWRLPHLRPHWAAEHPPEAPEGTESRGIGSKPGASARTRAQGAQLLLPRPLVDTGCLGHMKTSACPPWRGVGSAATDTEGPPMLSMS